MLDLVREEEKTIRYLARQKVSDILEQKKASVKLARLPKGSPDWDGFSQMTWDEIETGAKANKPGFKVVRKLLTDRRFDK